MLIVGADGLLGGALRRYWRERGAPVIATTLLPLEDMRDAQFLDLAQPAERWPELSACRAAVLCAAITSLEQCRRDPTGTRWINVTQTLRLAEQLAGCGAFVVFLSSNLVFDGSKPFRAPDEPFCPVTEYGCQKADAEKQLTALGLCHAVVRLTKVFHAGMPLVRGWLKALEQGTPIAPFEDFVCAPIALESVVCAIAIVAERALPGAWQLSAAADISYAAIARRLAERRKLDPALIQPVCCRHRADLEHVPHHTTLDARRSESVLGFQVPDPLAVIDGIFGP
jgi:dTDP-4-dehydrorhamnose reductase